MSQEITEAMIRDAFNQHKKTSLKALASYYDFAAGYEAALSVPIEGGDKGDGWEDLPQSPWPASDWAIERIAKLEEALGDLMTWFPEKPSEPEWRIKAGDYGADEAVSAARAALAAPSASIEGETP